MRKMKIVLWLVALFAFSSELFAENSVILSDSQVLTKYKKILSDEDLFTDLDFENDYEMLFGDFSQSAKKLVIDIYDENQDLFKTLNDEEKAKAYNAIFFAVASLSEPKMYWGTTAQKKLSSLPSGIWWKLSKLKVFFDENWEEFEKQANENLDKLKEHLVLIAQKEAKVAQKEIEYKKYWDKVDKYWDEVDRIAKMLEEIQKILN